MAEEQPEQTNITVATTGYFELYVNERNVTGDVMTPLRNLSDTGAIAITFDITRFIRPGANTLALWYSPAMPRADSLQLSVTCYGRYADGRKFARHSDGGWLCRKAPATLTNNHSETIDATADASLWNTGTADIACWLAAKENNGRENSHTEQRQTYYHAAKISNIRQQEFFDIINDSVTYDFGTAFCGLTRVTLRGARRGSHISIGNMLYICSGESDEQAIQRFTTTDTRRITISGDRHFRPEQVHKVEAMSISEYTRQWRY